MKRKKLNLTAKWMLQEQPRSPESGLILATFERQQQEGLLADWLTGIQYIALIPSNAGASTVTGTAYSVANITEKLLIVYSVGTIGGGSISCQLQSCVSGGGSPASVGAAFGTTNANGQFQADMESFTNTYARVVVTIVTGPTPIAVIGMGQSKLN